jgi:hypothetical protein
MTTRANKGVIDMINPTRIGLFSMVAFLAASTCITTDKLTLSEGP